MKKEYMPLIPKDFEIEDISDNYFYPLIAIIYNFYIFLTT